MTWGVVRRIAAYCAAWQALFACFQAGLRWTPIRRWLPDTFPVKLAPSYLVSLVHAIIISTRGAILLSSLFNADATIKFSAGADFGLDDRIALVESTACLFVAYLVYDLVHVALWYPKLGGMDMISHHIAFLLATIVAIHYRVMHFPFCWLVLAEISTVFLNLRWLTIKALTQARQRALQQRILQILNAALAVTFGITRVLVYGAGLLHLWVNLPGIRVAPGYMIRAIFCLLLVGYILNIMWFRKIVVIAFNSLRDQQRTERTSVAKDSSSKSAKA
mmetsp:Transcript_8166/g.21556  ORF Transcript_8166/g.21556 Transcript_8166/m.21556 type:complete len:276 (+) Transcript_8166:171-998(+)|eukprot:CAMPEP_0185837434 /NCGR_PEP_ID=MMETSP1353-20130828/11378_1 /TAXON_ID=1077150 /ORGANISM="Erythrolobus australicus, Strain CCMP3124" /LENGTH=275 /DNA_ID=CAMNT_0028536347 /DNA_START=163 /DNA_END=990 /DNA_ORIENTATION=+